MEKVEFKSSANLLKSVITKQAGNWRKGLKELVQNTIDGCLNIGVTPDIRIEVTPLEGGVRSLARTMCDLRGQFRLPPTSPTIADETDGSAAEKNE